MVLAYVRLVQTHHGSNSESPLVFSLPEPVDSVVIPSEQDRDKVEDGRYEIPLRAPVPTPIRYHQHQRQTIQYEFQDEELGE